MPVFRAVFQRKLTSIYVLFIVIFGLANSVSMASTCAGELTAPMEGWRNFSGRRFGSASLLQKINSDGMRVDVSYVARLGIFAGLIEDEGVILNLAEFEQWAMSRTALTSAEAREAFSKTLGFRTVYRALSLSKVQYQLVLEHGLYPSGLTPEEFLKAQSLRSQRSLDDDILAHLSRTSGVNLVQSVSDHPQIALAAAKGASSGDNSIYLFELRIAVIDLLYLNEDRPILTFKMRHSFREFLGQSLFVRNPVTGAVKKYSYSAETESFLLKPILTAQVVSITKFRREDCPDLEWR